MATIGNTMPLKACYTRHFQKPKKGLKLDGSDDNGDVPSMDMRLKYKSQDLLHRIRSSPPPPLPHIGIVFGNSLTIETSNILALTR
ncbi:hypothetical protein JHK82_016142 [Glycine max]|nr:hypothetical protein JHK85_016541 [Glycine max]KAG5046765.1 hypothetical protein JHK86_016171 [Glycine max]KAG5149261.1 hypothetical protein JHK82_016142 [Glycine max]